MSFAVNKAQSSILRLSEFFLGHQWGLPFVEGPVKSPKKFLEEAIDLFECEAEVYVMWYVVMLCSTCWMSKTLPVKVSSLFS